jgi:hypothetical protein
VPLGIVFRGATAAVERPAIGGDCQFDSRTVIAIGIEYQLHVIYVSQIRVVSPALCDCGRGQRCLMWTINGNVQVLLIKGPEHCRVA